MECACRRTGAQARLHEMPCGEHLLVVRSRDGGWTAAEDDGKTLTRFSVRLVEDGVELEDHDDGDRRRPFPTLAEALIAVCNLCGDPDAACRRKE